MDPERDKAILAEIAKWMKMNPNCLPVNFIVNEPDQSKLPEQMPVMLYPKKAHVKELVDKMKNKFPQYPYIYLFGKDHGEKDKAEKSLRERRKQKGKMIPNYLGLAVIGIDDELANTTVESAFARYKSEQGMLVVVVSGKQLLTDHSNDSPGKEWELGMPSKESVVCGLLFVVVLLYLFIVFAGDVSSIDHDDINAPL